MINKAKTLSSRRAFLQTTAAVAMTTAGPLGLQGSWIPRRQGGAERPGLEARMTQALKPFLEQSELAGVVAVTGRSTGLDGLVALGKARLDGDHPMKEDTPFRIASMTKPLTAAAVMMLANDGKLQPSDLVETHLSGFQGIQVSEKSAGGKTVTRTPRTPLKVEHLLSHTSGLPAYPKELGDVYGKRKPGLGACVDALAKQPLQFDPGSRWAYCNPGIDTLGRLIEVLSGQDYSVFLTRRIFEPLGMANTRFFPTAADRSQAAAIYDRKEGKLVEVVQSWGTPPVDAVNPVPAGGLWSTGPDMAKAAMAFLKLARDPMLKGILPGTLMRDMLTIRTKGLKAGFTEGMGFGYGWAVVDQPTGITQRLSPGSFGHGGAFGTQYWMDPVKDRFVILMIQRQGLANADASPMRKALQEAVFES